MFSQTSSHSDEGKLGGPIKGLDHDLQNKFYQTRELFVHQFTPEEGLGPLFNGASCFECHGQPGVIGGEGHDVSSTGVMRIGKRLSSSQLAKLPLEEARSKMTFEDVDFMIDRGGPALQRKSITSEFPNKYPPDCQSEIAVVPKDAELISLRHAGPLFGFGLIEAIPDLYITRIALQQVSETPSLAGRTSPHVDTLTHRSRIGRFGWKCQHASLLDFTAEALNVEMGVTTYVRPAIKSARAQSEMPQCLIKYLPAEPNDKGSLLAKLSYCQALFAPPDRAEITPQVKKGGELFKRLQCAVCHTPELNTAPTAYVVDPDSPAPALRWLEVRALENRPVRAYSDFLLHKMGPELADGLPQQGASGGEWRTTPLWGLRFKKFYLHNGATTDLEKAILLHGGQAKEVTESYTRLSQSEKSDLLAFLRSL